VVVPIRTGLPSIQPAERVVRIETLEHLEAQWLTLRLCARLVRRGGRLVVTTPNIASLRHRFELALRGGLTSFRPHELQHLTPALSHVIESMLNQEGMTVVARSYAGADVIPLSGGLIWPVRATRVAPRLLNISLMIAAVRPSAIIP
jgi:2-polyprenyl-3-methyl-5-hydroxy-6-metoxy-1,4-benzoquinol methylase